MVLVILQTMIPMGSLCISQQTSLSRLTPQRQLNLVYLLEGELEELLGSAVRGSRRALDSRTSSVCRAEFIFDSTLNISSMLASEFGCVTMSSFESMSATLDPKHWSLHGGSAENDCSKQESQQCPMRQCKVKKAPAQSFKDLPIAGLQTAINSKFGDFPGSDLNPMAYRNYPCDSIVQMYFGGDKKSLGEVGEEAFKKQLWQCMMGQALEMKSNIETRRSKNTLGTLQKRLFQSSNHNFDLSLTGITVWQYNEIWPTGGWGSIEYGCPMQTCPGQVVGGEL